MKTRTIETNHRIICRPRTSELFTPEDHAKEARLLERIVRNAVGQHYGFQRQAVSLRYDKVEVCALCLAPVEGSVLTEKDCTDPDDIVGLPFCCDEAQAEFRAEQAAAEAAK